MINIYNKGACGWLVGWLVGWVGGGVRALVRGTCAAHLIGCDELVSILSIFRYYAVIASIDTYASQSGYRYISIKRYPTETNIDSF
jgi:hypothetical protein